MKFPGFHCNPDRLWLLLLSLASITNLLASSPTGISVRKGQPTVREQWIPAGSERLTDGSFAERYQITANGIPVYGIMGRILRHSDGSEITTHNGNPDLKLVSGPVLPLSETEAFQQALNSRFTSEDFRLYYYPKGDSYIPAYVVYGHATTDLKRIQLVIDAGTGQLIRSEYHICLLDTVGVANTEYYGLQQIRTYQTGSGNYVLKSYSYGNGIETYDLNQQLNYGSVTSYTDSDNYWNAGEPHPAQHAADAHYCAQSFYDFLQIQFGRNSLDNQGMKLISYLNYGTNFMNAFWNGNAVVYGSGNSTYGPMTTFDISGHEFAHGLIQEMSGLQYQGEPGIIQEALADIFGTALEWQSDSSHADWLIGEDNGQPVRSMSDPGLFNHPDTYHGTNWYYGTGDNGGVHINCGFINKWFYLLSEGGSGTNDHGVIYSVQGIGPNHALQMIYRVMQTSLLPGTGFEEFMDFTIQASSDLYGRCSPEMLAVIAAWKAVGLNPEPLFTVQLQTPAPYCSGDTVRMNASGASYSEYQWYKDGTLLDQGINLRTVELTESGMYTVSESRCGTTFTQSPVQVLFHERPAVQLTGGQICEGEWFMPLGIPSGGVYSIPVPYQGPSTQFSYTVTSSFGCASVVNATVQVVPLPSVTVSELPRPFFADDPKVQMTAWPSGGTWSGTGITGSYFDPVLAGPGLHYLIYESANSLGCLKRDSVLAEVLSSCRPFDVDCSISGAEGPVQPGADLTLQVLHISNATTLDWVLPDGTILEGDPSNPIIRLSNIAKEGEIQAWVKNWCGDSIVLKASIEFKSMPELQAFPNPAHGPITVTYRGPSTEAVGYHIYDATGRIIQSGSFGASQATISGLTPGIYRLETTDVYRSRISIMVVRD